MKLLKVEVTGERSTRTSQFGKEVIETYPVAEVEIGGTDEFIADTLRALADSIDPRRGGGGTRPSIGGIIR